MDIIKRPVLTEKSINLYKNEKKATFEVDLNADKKNAKNNIEKLFGVKVGDLKTITRLGKKKVDRKTRKTIRLQSKKFMVAKLDKNSKIDIFEAN